METNTDPTVADVAKECRLSFRLGDRPDDHSMPDGARHYRCVLSRGKRRFTFWYSMGPALERDPDVAEVLDSLLMDANCVRWDSFEQFCHEYGYDQDSRKALATYKACEKTAKSLERLGIDLDTRRED